MRSRRWSRTWIAAALVTVALVSGLAFWFGLRRPVVLPQPREAERSPTATRADFVGAERCASCHATQYAAWERSTHGRAGGPPSAQTVIAPFGAAIVFANARVTPRSSEGVYEFVVEQRGEARRVFRVDGVVGGGHIYGGGTQAFVSRWEDGTLRMLPFEWSRQSRTWFCNTNARSGKGWAPITPATRIEECSDWPPMRVLGDHPRFTNCQSCHASQASLELDTIARKYDTRLTSLAINCESCHGPGRRHVELAQAGSLGRGSDIGLTALATLDKDASLRVCYQCHAVKDRIRGGFLSGDSLAVFYSAKLPLLGDRPLFPDGRVRTFAYQEGHQYSDCYLNGGMTCTSCHDPHSQTYRTVTGETLRDRFDDRQCTSCHVSKAENPPAHTKHQAASVRCTSCHMPLRQEPDTRATASHTAVVPYTRSDHTIPIPRPARDAMLGLVSACNACHQAMPVAQQEQQMRAWWGEIKPVSAVVAAQLSAQQRETSLAPTVLLSDTAASARNTFAQMAGTSRFLETQIRPNTGLDPAVTERLRALAGSRDVDVRATALAALHLAAGAERGTRRALASALRAEGEHDLAVRSRWAIALGYMGDQYAANGDLAAALTAYTRALEVRPSSAALLMSRANVQRDAGDLSGAIASYQSSLAVDRTNSLAWVNFGIALGAAGDTTAAITALTNAATLDPSEPLAWFNLGNISFVRGDLPRADSLYQRAAALNSSIALAQFQLARVSLMSNEYAAALSYLRRGLAFDSSDASARQAAADLTKRLNPGAAKR